MNGKSIQVSLNELMRADSNYNCYVNDTQRKQYKAQGKLSTNTRKAIENALNIDYIVQGWTGRGKTRALTLVKRKGRQPPYLVNKKLVNNKKEWQTIALGMMNNHLHYQFNVLEKPLIEKSKSSLLYDAGIVITKKIQEVQKSSTMRMLYNKLEELNFQEFSTGSRHINGDLYYNPYYDYFIRNYIFELSRFINYKLYPVVSPKALGAKMDIETMLSRKLKKPIGRKKYEVGYATDDELEIIERVNKSLLSDDTYSYKISEKTKFLNSMGCRKRDSLLIEQGIAKVWKSCTIYKEKCFNDEIELPKNARQIVIDGFTRDRAKCIMKMEYHNKGIGRSQGQLKVYEQSVEYELRKNKRYFYLVNELDKLLGRGIHDELVIQEIRQECEKELENSIDEHVLWLIDMTLDEWRLSCMEIA